MSAPLLDALRARFHQLIEERLCGRAGALQLQGRPLHSKSILSATPATLFDTHPVLHASPICLAPVAAE